VCSAANPHLFAEELDCLVRGKDELGDVLCPATQFQWAVMLILRRNLMCSWPTEEMGCPSRRWDRPRVIGSFSFFFYVSLHPF